jgi:hypothetical protein
MAHERRLSVRPASVDTVIIYMTTDGFLTTKDVSQITGLSVSGVALHIERGNLRASLVGHSFVIRTEDFRAWMGARARGQFTRQWKKAEREALS